MTRVTFDGAEYEKLLDGTLVPIPPTISVELSVDQFNVVYDLICLVNTADFPVFSSDAKHRTISDLGRSVLFNARKAFYEAGGGCEGASIYDYDDRFWRNLNEV